MINKKTEKTIDTQMRTLEKRLKKFFFFLIFMESKWLWCDPKGRWMVGKTGERCGRRTFVFHSVVYWNHILGGVHAMIWPSNDKSKGLDLEGGGCRILWFLAAIDLNGVEERTTSFLRFRFWQLSYLPSSASLFLCVSHNFRINKLFRNCGGANFFKFCHPWKYE